MFQDMAVGYAWSVLGDYFLAQDAAQEAFIQAYVNLPRLKEPGAFAGWLRRIVFSCCTRIIRRRNNSCTLYQAIGKQKRVAALLYARCENYWSNEACPYSPSCSNRYF